MSQYKLKIKLFLPIMTSFLYPNHKIALKPPPPNPIVITQTPFLQKSAKLRAFIQTKNNKINILKKSILDYSHTESFNKRYVLAKKNSILNEINLLKEGIESFFKTINDYYEFQSDLEFDLNNLVDSFNYSIVDAMFTKACYKIAIHWGQCFEKIELFPKEKAVNLLVLNKFMDMNIFLEFPVLALKKIEPQIEFYRDSIAKRNKIAQGRR